MNQNSYLQVVNASAGSGKTYSLVKTYIRLLLTDEGENADNKYSEILAMTFTNKAALEMKTRIVKALDELAYADEADYIRTIAEETGLKTAVIREKAQRLLSGILHRYEDFHVMTIDKFNLRLIRSFSRDLDLPPDFEVVLNEVPVIEQVVDGILERIGKKEDKELSDMLLHYANANMEDEKSWDLRKSLIDFGKVLSSEQDLPYVEQLMNTEFSEEDYGIKQGEKKRLENFYREKVLAIQRVFNDFLLKKEDFKNGHHIANKMDKNLSDETIEKTFLFTVGMLGNIENPKNSDASEFSRLVFELKDWYEINVQRYFSLKLLLKNYFNMALLKYMNKALLELNKQERLIRISEFNTRISHLLREDTPYIYEKLGTRFRHFMLDEFQDTSRLQWLNLIPLVRESLGNGQKNFIVGDPKQAIYRFKNGVAEQFVELPGIYNPEQNTEISKISNYFKQMGRVDVLEDNWRSAPDIVAFNNELFEQLRIKLSEEQKDFYASVKQNPKSKQKGYVFIESKPFPKHFSAEEKNNDKLQFVLSCVQDALNDGFKAGEICILGRGNKFCNFIATALTNEKYKVVSADSLNIDSELTVRFVISYFKLRLNPVNQNILRQFLHTYCELFNHPLEYYNSLFETIETEDKKTIKTAKIDLFFQKNPPLSDDFFEPFETLYDLIQKTFRLFDLHELKNPYLHHLADLVHLFETKNGPDLNLFLQEYDTMPKDAKALQIPESDDALKVMTIHKSKGLEFPVVIVINDMDTKVKGNFFIETEDYLLRSTLSEKSPVQEIRTANEEELSKVYLDTLNLYYVAYTRPVNRLYVKNDVTSGLSTEIHQVLKQMQNEEDGEEIRFVRGEKEIRTTETERTGDVAEFYTPQSSTDNLWFPDIALQDSEELTTEDFLSDEQRYGNQFHLAISSIHHKDEIDSIVWQLIQTGDIEHDFKTRLKEDLTRLFETAEYNQLFQDAVDILSEQNYIISRNEQIRPDKIILKKDKTVVLDYKTGQPQKKHLHQVQQYKSVLQEMNYPNVEAFLFYTKDLRLEEV